MTVDALAFGKRVRWQGHLAEIMDIMHRAHASRVRVQIRVLDLDGRPVRWVWPAELTEGTDARA